MWQQTLNLDELNESQQNAWQQVLIDQQLDELAADQVEAWQPVFEVPGLAKLSAEQITALGALIGATKNKTAAEIKQSEFFISDAYQYIYDSTPMQISAFIDLTFDDVRAYGALNALADLDDEGIVFFRQLREQMNKRELALDVPFDGAKPLAHAIRKNTSWTSATIHYAGGDSGTSEIIDALRERPLFATLRLSCQSFGASGLHMLSRLLEQCVNLQSLTVSACDSSGVYPVPSSHAFGDAALRIFAEALARNKTLRQLTIRRPHHEVGQDGDWRVLAGALLKNRNLSELDLSSCALSAGEISTIINALKQNGCKNLGDAARGLKRLALENNEVNELVCEAVAEMLRVNNTLEALALYTEGYRLDLEAGDFSAVNQEVYSALRENVTLRQLTGFGVEHESEVASDEPLLTEHGLSMPMSDLSPQDQLRLSMAEPGTDEYSDLIVQLQGCYEQAGSGDETSHETDDNLLKLSLLLERNQSIYEANQRNQDLNAMPSDTPSSDLVLSGGMYGLFGHADGAGASTSRPSSPGPGCAH